MFGAANHAESGHNDHVRLEIHVRPNASRTFVGGGHDGALVVRVRSAAEGGKATRSALTVIAEAFGVPRRSVTLVRGPASRRKLVDIEASGADDERLAERLRQLLTDPT
jgi:uncharacterized protein (TIGR00251 family)